MIKKVIIVIFVISIFQRVLATADLSAELQLPVIVYLNNKACLFVEDKTLGIAYTNLVQAMSYSAKQAELYLNLGLVFDKQNNAESALKAYFAAAQLAVNDTQKFAAFFNSAVVAAQSKDIDRALAFYQQALEYQPDSYETKVNIELLMQSKGGGGGDGQQDQSPDDKGQSAKKEYQPNPTPAPFKSKELSIEDVRKIFEELKRQEQEIRSKNYGESPKEIPRDKDW